MDFTSNLFSIILIVSGLTTVFIAIYILQWMGGAVKWFSCMMLAIAIWALGYGIELSTTTLVQMLFWINIEYFGVALIPAFWIVFIIKFVGKDQWLNAKSLSFIFSIPVVTLLLVWTNAVHHLHYAQVAVDISGPFPLLAIEPGPWYRVHTVYFYAMLAWGVYLLVAKSGKTDVIYKKQNVAIITGALVPWFTNLIYLIGIRPFGHIDLTPYAFITTALVISFGLLRFKLLDIVPVAREKVIEAMREGVLVLDVQHRIIDVNAAMKKFLLPYSPEIIGKDLVTLFPNEKKLHELVSKNISDKVTIQFTAENSHRFFEVNISLLHDKKNVYSGIILLFRDITEEKQAEEKLKEQAEQLLALNQLKDRLFSIIAHDLRSPLVSLTDILRMAEEGDIAEREFRAFLPLLSKNVGYTSGLLENLLHWSSSQLQGETINPQIFDLNAITEDKIHLFEKKAFEKGIYIHNKVMEKTWVYADQNMIELILRNLLANAIKFCKKDDKITITSEVVDQFTTVCVCDTGVGISEKNLNKLFGSETFTTQGTDKEKGTGLGLLLCKDFIEKNNGKIWVESTVGKGSEFYFTVQSVSLATLPALMKDTKNA